MTPEQIRAIKLLAGCTFLPASYDKRFVRSMVALLTYAPEKVLSERQHTVLMEKVHRYRRQHGQCTCLECLEEAMKKDNPYQQKLFEEERMR